MSLKKNGKIKITLRDNDISKNQSLVGKGKQNILKNNFKIAKKYLEHYWDYYFCNDKKQSISGIALGILAPRPNCDSDYNTLCRVLFEGFKFIICCELLTIIII